jgi:hypothetical protein
VRLRWIFAAAGALLVVGVAIAYYFTQVPGTLAEDYKEQAEPEQQRIRAAMRPVYRSLSAKTFGTDNRSIEKAKNPDQLVRAIDRTTSRELRQLAPAQKAIDRARRILEKADEEALLDTPSWPLLGGRGDLEDADAIADRERRYMREARAFLKHYERVVGYTRNDIRFVRSYGVTFGRGFGAIPDNPSSPGQVTRPLDRTARQLDRHLRGYREVKAPPELRRDHKTHVALLRYVIARIRELSSAVEAQDLGRLNRWERDFTRGMKRFRVRVTVRKFVTSSSYAKSVRKLRDMERSLLRAYARL